MAPDFGPSRGNISTFRGWGTFPGLFLVAFFGRTPVLKICRLGGGSESKTADFGPHPPLFKKTCHFEGGSSGQIFSFGPPSVDFVAIIDEKWMCNSSVFAEGRR